MSLKYRPARVYNAGGQLEKQWYVYFFLWNEKTEKFERVIRVGNINSRKTLEEKEAAARELCDQLNAMLADGKVLQQLPKEYTFLAKLRRMLERHLPTLRPRSRDNYAASVRRLGEFLEHIGTPDLPPEQVKKPLVMRFSDYLIGDRQIAQKTRNRTFGYLHTLCALCVEREELPFNPFEKIRRLKETTDSTQPFSDDDRIIFSQYLRDNDPEMLLFVQIMFYTFIRPFELGKLTVANFRLKEGKLYIPAHCSKNCKAATLTLPPQMVDILRSYTYTVYTPEKIKEKTHDILPTELKTASWDELPKNAFLFGYKMYVSAKEWHRNRITERHRAHLRKCNMPDNICLYSWKPTGVIAAARAKINIVEIKEHLRHASLDQVQDYLAKYGVFYGEEIKSSFPSF